MAAALVRTDVGPRPARLIVDIESGVLQYRAGVGGRGKVGSQVQIGLRRIHERFARDAQDIVRRHDHGALPDGEVVHQVVEDLRPRTGKARVN